MESRSSAGAPTPADWVSGHAGTDPDATALLFADGAVTYAQLADQVARRARDVRAEYADGDVVSVPVRLDLASIVELLAHQAAGTAPLPTSGVDRPPEVRAEGAVVCVRTSGTTGNPRVVPLSMRNVAASVAASRDRLGTGAGDRWLLCLPIDHIGGLSVLFRSFEAGGTVVVARFDPALGDILARTRPTVASMVPTMVHRLLDRDPDRLASIGGVLVGGGPLPARVVDRAGAAGVGLIATYGSTETSSQVATVDPGMPITHPGYVGRPLQGVSVAVDASGAGAGRIVVDGPGVFGGYLGGPRRSGPFTTGDIGRLADDGSLTVLGRADDVVVTGGENIALGPIAAALEGFDVVDAAVVVGAADDEWGTAICGFIVTTADLDTLRARARERLDPVQVPKRWILASRLPLLATGKPDRAAIERAFAEPVGSGVWISD